MPIFPIQVSKTSSHKIPCLFSSSLPISKNTSTTARCYLPFWQLCGVWQTSTVWLLPSAVRLLPSSCSPRCHLCQHCLPGWKGKWGMVQQLLECLWGNLWKPLRIHPCHWNHCHRHHHHHPHLHGSCLTHQENAGKTFIMNQENEPGCERCTLKPFTQGLGTVEGLHTGTALSPPHPAWSFAVFWERCYCKNHTRVRKMRAATHWLPCSTQLARCPSKHSPVVLGHPRFLLKSKESESNTKLTVSTQGTYSWSWSACWLFFRHLIITCKSRHGKMLCFLFQLGACTCWDDAWSLCGCCWLSWDWEFTWSSWYLCKWWPLESFKRK